MIGRVTRYVANSQRQRMDGIPVVDCSSLPVDVEKLNSDELNSTAERIMNAFTTFGVVRLGNIGIDEELVGQRFKQWSKTRGGVLGVGS